MLVQCYSLKDLKSGEYGQPFGSPNDDTAKREFLTAMQNEKSMLHMYPTDFELYYVFTYESTTAQVVDNTQRFLCNATFFTKKEEINE